MQNRVGDTIPSEKAIASDLNAITTVHSHVREIGVDLTAEERGATLKQRQGGEPMVALIAKLAQEHGVTLPNVSVEAMQKDLKLAQTLKPLRAAADQLSQTLSDTILEAESEAWWTAMAYYTALVRMADTDARLANDLKPLIDFMAVGRRKKPA